MGQRDQSAAALPISGGLATAMARLTPRVVFVMRVVVVTRVVFLGPSIENGSSVAPEFETCRSSTSSIASTGIARTTFSARRIGGPGAGNPTPRAWGLLHSD